MPNDNFDKYADKDLLCYAYTLPNGSMRVYPQYVLESDGQMIPLQDGKQVFKPNGAIFFPETNLCNQWSESEDTPIMQLHYKKGRLEHNLFYDGQKDYYIGKSKNDVRVFPFRYNRSYPCLYVNMDSDSLKQELKFSYSNVGGALIRVSNASLYVRCADAKILGPFAYEYDNNEIKLTGKKSEDYYVKVYNEVDVPKASLKEVNPGGEEGTHLMCFISSYAATHATIRTEFDCMSELDLKDYVVGEIKTYNQNKERFGQVKALLTPLTASSSVIPEARKKKIKSLIDKVQQYQDLPECITEMILGNPDTAKAFLYATIYKSPKIFGDLINEKAEIKTAVERVIGKGTVYAPVMSDSQIETYKKRLSDMEGALNKARSEASEARGLAKTIDELNLQKEKMNDEVQRLSKDKNDLSTEIENLRKSKETSESELRSRNARLEVQFEDAVKRQMKKLEGKIEQYKDETEGFADHVDRKLISLVQCVIADAEKKINNKLLPEVVASDAVSAGPMLKQSSTHTKTECVPLPVQHMDYTSNRKETGKAIIARVRDFLRSSNRYVDDDDVANYLICLTQGFVTTFAGSPGSGKTSLCNLLAQALGLVNGNYSPRFIDVPVARGWTSTRDFIGYYNPLSQKMVKSNAMLYDALDAMQKEDGESVPPLVVMLDEANLSSIEHYWSVFLKNSDFSSSINRCFSLGGDENWRIANHLRFLATVNHDHTTEELSPRFLDRSWVIVLQPTLDDEEDFVDAPPTDVQPAVPFGSLLKAFGICRVEENFEDRGSLYDSKLNSIKQVFRKFNIPIMPRSAKMVSDYVKIASLYMSEEYKAFDYAIAQKLLPSISGSGPAFRECLNELQNLCSGGALPQCHRLISGIIKAGDEGHMDIYDFFAR